MDGGEDPLRGEVAEAAMVAERAERLPAGAAFAVFGEDGVHAAERPGGNGVPRPEEGHDGDSGKSGEVGGQAVIGDHHRALTEGAEQRSKVGRGREREEVRGAEGVGEPGSPGVGLGRREDLELQLAGVEKQAGE